MKKFTVMILALILPVAGIWYLMEPDPALAGAATQGTQAGQANDVENATMDSNNWATAMFGAGCFWGVEAAFRQIEGVKATAVGYAGGHVDNPTYKEVCSDTTGHAEVVQVMYDPSVVSYDKLLEVFWKEHDPTQVNRQGPDIGYQYRSVIFYTTPEQEAAANASKERLEKSGDYNRPIATSIEAAPTFWKAEEYHQQYLEKRGLSTCRIK
jgi:peptide-methionine (S)-S-oxide reductase